MAASKAELKRRIRSLRERNARLRERKGLPPRKKKKQSTGSGWLLLAAAGGAAWYFFFRK